MNDMQKRVVDALDKDMLLVVLEDRGMVREADHRGDRDFEVSLTPHHPHRTFPVMCHRLISCRQFRFSLNSPCTLKILVRLSQSCFRVTALEAVTPKRLTSTCVKCSRTWAQPESHVRRRTLTASGVFCMPLGIPIKDVKRQPEAGVRPVHTHWRLAAHSGRDSTLCSRWEDWR